MKNARAQAVLREVGMETIPHFNNMDLFCPSQGHGQGLAVDVDLVHLR